MSHNDVDMTKKENKPKDNQTKENKHVDKRSLSLKLFSVGSIIAIIAIMIVFNILFESMLGNVLLWDLTGTQNNSIGDISKGILSQLDKDVEIVGLFELSPESEQTYKDFIPLLRDYETESGGRIKVRYVDPEKYPSIVKDLDPNKTISPTAGSFVIKSGDRLKVIYPEECFTLDEQAYYAGQVVFTSNSIEMNFTGAIQSVTSGEQLKVYFTTNHQEATHVQITSLLSNNGFLVEDVSTLSLTAIPEDCDMMIMQLPQMDISKEDIVLLTDYLEKGGNLVVITDFSSANLSFPNLNEVMHTMNLNITDSLISENDMNYRIQATDGYGSYANIAAGTFSGSEVDKAIFAAFCRGINTFDNPKPYIVTEPLIITSVKAVLQENGDPTKVSVEGNKNIAMYSSSTFGAVPGEVVVIGTSYLTSDAYIENYSLNDQNVIFFASVVKKMLGMDNTVQIPVKEYPNFNLESKPSVNVQTVISVVLIAVVPLALITAAIVIYRKRKHL